MKYKREGEKEGVQKHLFDKIDNHLNKKITHSHIRAHHMTQSELQTKINQCKKRRNIILPISKLRMQNRDQSKQSEHSHIKHLRDKDETGTLGVRDAGER